MNPTGITQKLEKGTIVGKASDADCVQGEDYVNWNSGAGGEVREGDHQGVGGEDVEVLGGAGDGVGWDGAGGGGGQGMAGCGVGGKDEEVKVVSLKSIQWN